MVEGDDVGGDSVIVELVGLGVVDFDVVVDVGREEVPIVVE